MSVIKSTVSIQCGEEVDVSIRRSKRSSGVFVSGASNLT